MEAKQADGTPAPEWDYLVREACDPETAPERLCELSEIAELRPLVAANLAAPSALLAQLSKDLDSQVRRAVAGNANSPLDRLLHLASEFPEVFFRNPLCTLLDLAHPGWRAHVEDPTWLALLKREEIPRDWLLWLDQEKGYNETVSSASRQLRDPYDVWVAARLHITQPEPHANGEHIGRALAQGIATVATNERTPVPLLAQLSSIDCQYRSFAEIGGGACEYIRRDVAQNRATPVEVLRSLAADPDTIVRHRVGKNRSTPPDLLAQLAADSSVYVRSGVASNEQAPAKILAHLATDTTYEEKYAQARQRVAPHASLHEVSRMQAQEAFNNLRLIKGSLARNEATPPHILLELAKHPEIEIRERLACNPSAPEEVLVCLAGDVRRVLESLIEHPRLPVAVLMQLATHPLDRVRSGVASHPRTPPAVLENLAEDEHVRVREAVAQNPATPFAALAHLATGSTHAILQALANNPGLSVDLLEHLLITGEESNNVLRPLVQHPDISLEWLRRLARSETLVVHQAARRRLERLEELGERGLTRYPYVPYLNPCFEDDLMQIHHLSMPLYQIQARVLELKDKSFSGPDAFWLRDFLSHFQLPAALRQEIFALLLPSWCRKWKAHTEESQAWLELLAEFEFSPVWKRFFAASPLWKERYAMAVRPDIETETLAQLANDGNRYVRAAACWYLRERQDAA